MVTFSSANTPYILVISSGKGGVGKSVISVNLANALACSGVKVLLWDANRSFPNCHLMLGVEPPVRLSEVYSGMIDITKAIYCVEGSFHLLADHPGSGLDSNVEQVKFIDVFRDLVFDTDFDIIIIDSTSGVSVDSLEAASIADEVNIVITDEPTSLLDGYGLIKYLLNYIDKQKLKLIVNNVIDIEDGKEISEKLNLATEKFLGFEIEVNSLLPYDRLVRKSIVKQELFVKSDPSNEISKAINDFSHKIANMLSGRKIHDENLVLDE